MSDNLSPRHLKMLREESGISDAVIEARGYRTITNVKELEAIGFPPAQRRVPGLLLPLHATDGTQPIAIYRPDNPRVIEQKRKRKNPDGTYPNKVLKYEMPKGSAVRVDCPPMARDRLSDPKPPLWITEGQKKGDSLVSRGLCAIALLGVWNFKGRNDLGGTTILVDFDNIAWDGRDVRIVFDSDAMTKPPVSQALDRLTEILQRRKAHVAAIYLPPGKKGKVGVDDWLAEGHTVEELEALVESPRPKPKAAAPILELLDEAPLTIARPLSLLGGRGYAATWLYIRLTYTETEADGVITRHDPPLIVNKRSLFIVRDDGTIFGGEGDASVTPLDDLSLDVRLPEIPREEKTWSANGVKHYRAGHRPDPVDVFNRVTDVVDRFLDFSRSLADQRTMAEMIAGYILTTYFLPAFNVTGFLWPSGDRGSGKTHLLTTVTELAYLGQLILSGSSYATLRDLADYGSTLAFDDAENLADPKKTDPDKRTLLLAGNRRGTTVTLKELRGDQWITRYVDAYCPRLFSATYLPDPILASRTIIVPLIRTPDRYKANADPLDRNLWPHDRRQLIDDLWATVIAHLPELPAWEAYANDNASLTGRNLDPWRAMLAVAAWLDDQDCDNTLRRNVTRKRNGEDVEEEAGLWDRLDALSVNYQTERPDLETSDLTALVIRGLMACVAGVIRGSDVSDVSDIGDINRESSHSSIFTFKTSRITDMTRLVAETMESDVSDDYINSRRVGRALGKMRLEKDREGGKGTRQWKVPLWELERWGLTYGIPLADYIDTLSGNVTVVTDVTTSQIANGAGGPASVRATFERGGVRRNIGTTDVDDDGGRL